jgi:hypothetical protein
MKSQQQIRSITPEKAQEILLKNGVQVSLDKAALVLDYLYFIANLEVNDFNREK